MTVLRLLPVVFALVLLAPGDFAFGAEDRRISFKRDIAPILVQQCQTCHGGEKVKGKYRVDSFQHLLTAGSSGDPSVTAGKPEQSSLFKLLVTDDEDERMPKKADPLPKAQIELVRKWIEQGAKFDGPNASAMVATYVEAGGTAAAPTVYKRPIPITTLAFSADGKSLLANGFHELTQWDPKSGKLTGRIPLPVQRVQSIAIDANTGRLAVVGGTPGVSGELLLLEPAAADQSIAITRSLVKAADLLLSVRFSPDGKTLAAGGADGSLRVFDVASGTLVWKADPHADWVTDIAFSPDSQRLVTASRDKSCRVLEVKTGLGDATYAGHTEPVFAVIFSGDGGHVFSGGRDRRLHMWASSNGNAKGSTGDFGGDIVRLDRIGNRLFSVCADGFLREHAADKGVAPATKPDTKPSEKKQSEKPQPRELTRKTQASREWLYGVATSPDAGFVAAGSHDGKVHVYSIKDGKLVTTFTAAP